MWKTKMHQRQTSLRYWPEPQQWMKTHCPLQMMTKCVREKTGLVIKHFSLIYILLHVLGCLDFNSANKWGRKAAMQHHSVQSSVHPNTGGQASGETNEGNNPGSEGLKQTERRRLCLKSVNTQGGRCRGQYNELIGEMKKKHIQMLHRSFSPWVQCMMVFAVHPTYQDALWAIMSPLRRMLIHIIHSDNSRLIQPEI